MDFIITFYFEHSTRIMRCQLLIRPGASRENQYNAEKINILYLSDFVVVRLGK